MNWMKIGTLTKNILAKLKQYKNHNLYYKWDLIYMRYNIKDTNLKFKNKYQDSIFIAQRSDMERIKKDLYPNLIDENYDLKYFKRLGEEGLDCVLCEQDGKLIHYSWIFYNLLDSPLGVTPMKLSYIERKAVFWGPTLTVPSSRGMVYPYVFANIVNRLKTSKDFEEIILIAYKGNKGAIPFYKKLGFVEFENQPKPSIGIRIIRRLDVSKYYNHKK